MGKPSMLGPGTEAGKLILEDFKNWQKTGFKPFSNVGSVSHQRSQQIYQIASQSAFCSQAKKIAAIALEQMLADEIKYQKRGSNDNEKSLLVDSEKKNPWELEVYNKSNKNSSEDDADYSISSKDESSGSDRELGKMTYLMDLFKLGFLLLLQSRRECKGQDRTISLVVC